MNFLKSAFYFVAIASLGACGGSGGGGSSSVDPGSGSGGGTTPTNNAPAFTTGSTATLAEGATAVATLEASDEEGDTLTFAFGGGADDALFTLDESTGTLAFASAPDFEAPGSAAGTNVYTIIVTVSDETNDAVPLTIEITVTDVASPAFTTTAAQSLVEGGTTVATIAAAGAVTMTGGADLSKFTLSSMNALTFNAAPDFENPLDADSKNTYEVTFTATEGTETSTLAMTVTVKDAYEGRVIDGPVSGSNVFTDCDGDTIQDVGEFSATSDSNGFYFVEKASECASPKLVAIGGTDTSTGTEIPDLALVADVPASDAASAYITPISTVVALATTASEKEAVLSAFGITGLTPEQLLTKDIWADSQSADAATASLSLAIANVNVQIATILQTAVTLVDTSNSDTAALRAVTMVSEMSKALVTKATEVTASSNFVSGSLLSATSDLESALTAAFTAYETAAVTLTSLSNDVVVVAAGQTVAEAVALKVSAFTSTLEESTARLVETVNQIAAISDITSAVATQALKLREDKVAQLDAFVAQAESAFTSEYATYTAAIASAGADTTAVSTAIATLNAGIESSVEAAVTTAITTLETTLDSLETAAATAAAALETELVTTGHKLPTTITVLETVE